MADLCEIFHCYDPNPDEEFEYGYSEIWKAFTIKGETKEFESGHAKSSSIRNPVLRYLHRAMTQLIFARVDGGGVSQTELDVMWYLLTKRGFNLGMLITIYLDRISKKDGSIICCGGLITAIAEHVGIPTVDLTTDMGEMFITYKLLFAMGLMKMDSSDQAFFIQGWHDHFPVPIPYLTKVDTWTNQTMWKLNTSAHRRAIEATPIEGEFRKRNIPTRIPDFDPRGGSHLQREDEQSNAHGGGQPREEEEEEVEGHRRRNRANRRRGRPDPQADFQANTSACLGEMFS